MSACLSVYDCDTLCMYSSLYVYISESMYVCLLFMYVCMYVRL